MALRNGPGFAAALVGEALDHAEQATVELRELVARASFPPVLRRSGLARGGSPRLRRVPVPVEGIGLAVDRLPAAVEATAYFVMAEALTNVAKHSHAHHATVVARVEDDTLQLRVRDDGIGGARLDGSGLRDSATGSPLSTAGSEWRAPSAKERSCPQRFPWRTSYWRYLS